MDLIGEVLPLLLLLFMRWINVADATIYAYNAKNETHVFDDLEANFGPGVNSDGIVGVLLRAEPYEACSDIKPPPIEPDYNSNVTIFSFVLIKRGTCDFALKVFNAQKAGYRAAIVHNVESDNLVKMSSGLPSVVNEIYIPSVFVGQTTASELNKTFLYNSRGSPYIQLYETQFNPLDYYLVPFVIVIAVCFISLLFFLLIKCLRDRRRARRGRLSLQRLKKLPVKKFDKGDEYDVCAICLDDYEEGDSLRILPCDHAYHCKCVDPWLTSSRRICPLCKRRVLSDDESSSSDDGDDTTDDERTPLTPSSAAASPNAPMYATGYGSRNPFMGRRQVNRRISSSSDDTTSTDVSDVEHERTSPRQRAPQQKTVTVSLTNELPQSSGYQSQQLSSVTDTGAEIVNPMLAATGPDAYLDTAEAMMAGPSRVSESSIAVLSDVETVSRASTPDPHSCSSHDFHSLDESTVEGQTPVHLDLPGSVELGSDHDDIVVIAQGSKSTLQGNGSEV